MNLHLSGMGVQGSILAWNLFRRGIDFTWHDTEEKVSAWPASTGCVYPSGDADELEAYCSWRGWHETRHIPGISDLGAFWFLTKNPPHGGKYGVEAQVGALRMGSRPTVHVNVQELVRYTRTTFAAVRTDEAPTLGFDTTVIVSHGFDPRRLAFFKWGWSAKAKLQIAPEILRASEPFGRPNLYLKRGAMSFLIYAYPVPGESENWYAGSSVIRQQHSKSLGTEKKVAFWKDCVEKTSDGAVKVLSVGEPVEGWRPCAKDDDTALARWIDGQLVVKPMSHSGVRLSPLVVAAVLKELGLK